MTEEAPSRQADLDRLFHAIADDPSDVTAREVLVDLLEDSGEPYAAVMHELLAGSTDEAKRLEALGPFRYYLEHVEYDEGGLWHEGQLIRDVPLDPAIGDAVAADQRLGLFRALRIGVSAFSVYEKLISSPRAVGLRVVDVPNASVLAALIAGKRTRLTTLLNVKFATRAVIDRLADPTFDRVKVIHTVTEARIVARHLDFFTRDEVHFFARAPRELILDDRDDDPDSLHDAVRHAWPKLPVKKITVGKLILER